MKPSRLRQACALVFNLLALLCVLQNLWESEVAVVRYAWCLAAAGVLYVIIRGAKAFRLFLRSRDSDAACLIFLAASSLLSLCFARGPGAEFANAALWGRALGSIARVLRFHDIFGSWWFIGMCSLLGAALSAKLISKRAWRPRLAGLSAARAGFVLLLLAGVLWKAAGRRGWLEFSDDNPTKTVFDADSLDAFELPFAVRLNPVASGAEVTILTEEGAVATAGLPLSCRRWRICAHEFLPRAASLYVVRDPGWLPAAVGLILVAGGLALDAAVSGRKGWS